jgi:hypothetical protein
MLMQAIKGIYFGSGFAQRARHLLRAKTVSRQDAKDRAECGYDDDEVDRRRAAGMRREIRCKERAVGGASRDEKEHVLAQTRPE